MCVEMRSVKEMYIHVFRMEIIFSGVCFAGPNRAHSFYVVFSDFFCDLYPFSDDISLLSVRAGVM